MERSARTAPDRLVRAAAAAGIAAWFLCFAHGGLAAALSIDDLMNLYGYVQKPVAALLLDNLRFWSTAYRPLGGLFYVSIYELFGLNPLPYRIACFAIVVLNLALLYLLTSTLAKSREIGFLATLIASYHAWFVDLYYSAGTVYELLCYALYLGALMFYTRLRARGSIPRISDLAVIAALYILALDAKEMAVTLPVVVLLYELVFHPGALRHPRRWIANEARATWVTGMFTLIYVAGKLTGPNSLVENPAYALHVTPGRYLDTFHLYLNPLLYQPGRFHDSNTVQLLLAMLVLAAVLRSRVLLYAWGWLLVTLLPVAFIAHYAAFFEYLPMVGWALYAAALLVTIRRAVVRHWPRLEFPSQIALALAVAGFLAPMHARESPKTLRLFLSVQPPSREIVHDLATLRPALPPHAHVLFMNDPFPKDSYFLLFTTRLYYRDLAIEVDRQPVQPPSQRYDAVFAFRGDRLVSSSPPPGEQMYAPEAPSDPSP